MTKFSYPCTSIGCVDNIFHLMCLSKSTGEEVCHTWGLENLVLDVWVPVCVQGVCVNVHVRM